MISHLLIAQNFSDTIKNNFTSQINGSWIVPIDVHNINIKCWGGGGAGGAAYGQSAAGGGGSGGAFAENNFNVIPGDTIYYSLGNGGIGYLNTNGGNGGNTWVFSSTSLVAKGGIGGGAANNFSTALGASAISVGNLGGIINHYGGAGGTGTFGGTGSMAGGGGGGAGTMANGYNALNRLGGPGGNFGGGDGADAGVVACYCTGLNGSIPGGGGSGGQASGPLDQRGGNGGGGMIVFSYVIPGIGGKIYADTSLDCTLQVEPILKGIKTILNPGNILCYTDSNGYWHYNNIDTGSYVVTIDTTVRQRAICFNNLPIVHSNIDSFIEVNPIGIKANTICTSPSISIHAPALRPCFSNRPIYIQVKNKEEANVPLINSYVIVELNPLLTIDSSSVPFIPQGNDQYRLDLGTINPGQTINFVINVTVNCGAYIGSTMCLIADLYPKEYCYYSPFNPSIVNDSYCSNSYDNSLIKVEGICNNDSVNFDITNKGLPGFGDMMCYSRFRIFKNNQLYQLDSLKINGGDSKHIAIKSNGETWVIAVNQNPFQPGSKIQYAFVEACPDTFNWVPNIVNNYPLNYTNINSTADCGVVRASFDPNDKQVFPSGLGPNYDVLPNGKFKYLINFQNTGTDTAFNIVIIDTLDSNLNLFTFEPTVSSHYYTCTILGSGVVRWEFNNILLPDSNTNEELSHGFLTYEIEQIPDLPVGTVIQNKAAIYFDYNSPLITNSVWNTINTFPPVVNQVIENETIKKTFLITPNPSSGSISFSNKSEEGYSLIYNSFGQLVYEKKLIEGENQIILPQHISDGFYFLLISDNDGKSISSSKFVLMK